MAFAGFVAGCGPREPALVNPGMSTADRFSGDPAALPSEAGAPADPGVDVSSAQPLGRAFVSRGHFAGRWTAVIAVNETALPTYTHLARSSRFASGSLLVKRHTSTSSAAPGPTFAMAKRDAGFYADGGDWEFVVLDAAGRLEDRGKLALCARCHAEATADWVFGLPAEAR